MLDTHTFMQQKSDPHKPHMLVISCTMHMLPTWSVCCSSSLECSALLSQESCCWLHTGPKDASSHAAMPAARSDAVAEALLDCCAVLLQRCPAQSGKQLLELMDRFASIASLGSHAAAEEVCTAIPYTCAGVLVCPDSGSVLCMSASYPRRAWNLSGRSKGSIRKIVVDGSSSTPYSPQLSSSQSASSRPAIS